MAVIGIVASARALRVGFGIAPICGGPCAFARIRIVKGGVDSAQIQRPLAVQPVDRLARDSQLDGVIALIVIEDQLAVGKLGLGRAQGIVVLGIDHFDMRAGGQRDVVHSLSQLLCDVASSFMRGDTQDDGHVWILIKKMMQRVRKASKSRYIVGSVMIGLKLATRTNT